MGTFLFIVLIYVCGFVMTLILLHAFSDFFEMKKEDHKDYVGWCAVWPFAWVVMFCITVKAGGIGLSKALRKHFDEVQKKPEE